MRTWGRKHRLSGLINKQQGFAHGEPRIRNHGVAAKWVLLHNDMLESHHYIAWNHELTRSVLLHVIRWGVRTRGYWRYREIER